MSDVSTELSQVLNNDEILGRVANELVGFNSVEMRALLELVGMATVEQLNAIVASAGNLPVGGTTGQIATKASNTDFDVVWSPGGAVTSVNGDAGVVVLTAADVGADPAGSATAAQAAAASGLAAHEADTTSVHGIVNTALLLKLADIGVLIQAFDAKLAAIVADPNGALLRAQGIEVVYYDKVAAIWPDAVSAPDGHVWWVATVNTATSPPSGGRPGSEEDDVLIMMQNATP